jgi:hypothetical protein
MRARHFRYHDDWEANRVWLCTHVCACGPWTHDSIPEDCELWLETEARCPTCIEDDEKEQEAHV